MIGTRAEDLEAMINNLQPDGEDDDFDEPQIKKPMHTTSKPITSHPTTTKPTTMQPSKSQISSQPGRIEHVVYILIIVFDSLSLESEN